MVGREGTDSQERGDYGNLRLFRQFLQFGVGVGNQHPVAGQNNRPFRLVNQFHRLRQLNLVGLARRLVSLQVHRYGPDKGASLADQHVLGNVQQHRAGPSRPGDVKSFLDRRRHVVHFHDQDVVFGDGQGNAGNVGFLESVPSDGRTGHLPGNRHHRNRVHHRPGNSRNQVGGPGAGSCGTDANLARGASVAVGSHGRRLLVAHQNVAQLGIAAQRPVEGQDGAPGQSKNDIDSFFEEAFTNYFGAGQFHFSLKRANKKDPSPKGRAIKYLARGTTLLFRFDFRCQKRSLNRNSF